MQEAREFVRKNKNEFDSAKTQTEKLKIFELTKTSENKTREMQKNSKLFEIKNRHREIANVYKRAMDQFGMRMQPTTLKYARMQYREYSRNRI